MFVSDFDMLWNKILTRLKVKVPEFIRGNEKKINKLLVEDFDGSLVRIKDSSPHREI